jgi:hypothetical protein
MEVHPMTALTLLCTLVLVAPSAPARGKPTAAPVTHAAAVTAAPKKAAVPTLPAELQLAPVDGNSDAPPSKLLKKARALYDALEYDRVIPLAQRVIASKQATIDERLDAYLLEGSATAIIGDPVEAEAPFRLLLRARPDFDMPADTPPKILASFRKVQVEEHAILQQVRELERRRMIQSLSLVPANPSEATGGLPVQFEYTLRDPHGVVEAMSVQYRRQGQNNFSALALDRDQVGSWRGQLPGTFTENETGMNLEYYVLTADKTGDPLLLLGNNISPLALHISPGLVPEVVPFYKTVWFWSVVSAAIVCGTTAGVLLYRQATRLPDSDLGVVPID